MSAFRSTRYVRFQLNSSRSRGGGKVGIPRTLRDFQARRESRLYDFSSERLFHRPARCRIGRLEGGTLRGISSQAMWSVGQAQSSIQVLMHHHRAARQRGSPARLLDLQAEILKAHRPSPTIGWLTTLASRKLLCCNTPRWDYRRGEENGVGAVSSSNVGRISLSLPVHG